MLKAFFSVAILLVLVNLNLNAQNLKLGIVDVQTVIMQMPEAQGADQMLKEITSKYQDTIAKMRKDLEEKLEQYKKQKAMMPQDQQQKAEEGLQTQNNLLVKYSQEKESDVYKLRGELLEPLRAKVMKAISEVAKAESMSFVFEKGGQAIVYSEEKFDITFLVIDKIKRGGGAATPDAKPANEKKKK